MAGGSNIIKYRAEFQGIADNAGLTSMQPQIVDLGNGTFVQATFGGTQIYSYTGAKIGTVVSNGTDDNATVAHLSNQQFVVASDSGAQLFDLSGNPVGSAISYPQQVGGPGGGQEPNVTALANGAFAIAYEDTSNQFGTGTNGDFISRDVVVQFYNSDGSTNGALINPSSDPTDVQIDPALTTLSDGRVLVTWTSATPADQNPTFAHQIRAAVIDPNGAASISDFVVAGLVNPQGRSAITPLANGGFAVVWETPITGQGETIFVNVYDSDGNVVAGPGTVATGVNGAKAPQVATMSNGEFVIVWQSDDSARFAQPHTSSIRSKLFFADGTADGSEFVVKTFTDAGEDPVLTNPTIAALPNDEFVISWNDGPTGQVRTQLYANAFDQTRNGSSGPEDLHTGFGNDTINAGGGIDTLNGGAGRDALTGGAQADQFVFDAFALVDAQLPTPVFDKITDYDQGTTGHYSAFEGDQIDISGLTGGTSITDLVKVFDRGDKGTVLMVDPDGAIGGNHYWDIAQLDGIHAGQTVNVVTNSAAPAGVNIGVESNQGYAGNFNAGTDGNSDLVWFNDTSRAIKIYELNGHSSGNQIAANLSVGLLPTGWHIDGIGDFNNDGNSDLLLQNDAGALKFWEMNGATVAHNLNAGTLPAGWHVKGTGDFNHDNISDIVIQNDTSGLVKLWEFNGHTSGAQLLHNLNVSSLPSTWGIVGVGDFNGDNNDDVLLRQDGGLIKIWEMTGNGSGAQILANLNVNSLSTSWHIEGVADFNNDGKSDILLVNDTGALKLWEMNGGAIAHNLNVSTLTSSQHVAGTGDFNGDGIDDILLRYDNGQAHVLELTGATSGNQILANLNVTTLDAGWSTQNHHYDIV